MSAQQSSSSQSFAVAESQTPEACKIFELPGGCCLTLDHLYFPVQPLIIHYEDGCECPKGPDGEVEKDYHLEFMGLWIMEWMWWVAEGVPYDGTGESTRKVQAVISLKPDLNAILRKWADQYELCIPSMKAVPGSWKRTWVSLQEEWMKIPLNAPTAPTPLSIVETGEATDTSIIQGFFASSDQAGTVPEASEDLKPYIVEDVIEGSSEELMIIEDWFDDRRPSVLI